MQFLRWPQGAFSIVPVQTTLLLLIILISSAVSSHGPGFMCFLSGQTKFPAHNFTVNLSKSSQQNLHKSDFEISGFTNIDLFFAVIWQAWPLAQLLIEFLVLA